MTITFLTAGTGSYYCGACMKDNSLARALQEAGHEVAVIPLYLPLELDEAPARGLAKTPVFYGGLNVWLQEKIPLFRKTPAWIDRLLNSDRLLRAVAKRSHLTSAREQGEMTFGMLNPETSHLQKESQKLLRWLAEHEKPDLIILSNALLSGMARHLRETLAIPVICTFQGEDSFLDGLPEPWKTRCWEALAERLRDCDHLIAPSQFYANLIAHRLNLLPEKIEVISNGIDPARFNPATPQKNHHIGYLARMREEKGLGLLVEAFILLKKDPVHETTRLAIAGAVSGSDAAYVALQKKKLHVAGLADHVSWHPNLDFAEKANFLASLTLFSVPATYPEAFGLYLIEAMAAGLPLVMPRASAFPEVLAASDSGHLHQPNDPAALAHTWKTLLADPAELSRLAKNSRQAAETHFSLTTMRDAHLRAFQTVTAASILGANS